MSSLPPSFVIVVIVTPGPRNTSESPATLEINASRNVAIVATSAAKGAAAKLPLLMLTTFDAWVPFQQIDLIPRALSVGAPLLSTATVVALLPVSILIRPE